MVLRGTCGVDGAVSEIEGGEIKDE